MSTWDTQEVRALFAKVRDTMPPDSPSSLPDEDYINMVALILQKNGFPAGNETLSANKLDGILSATSENWKLEQMAKVDRVVLRIAVYEITIDRHVPTKAAINESIELAKTFSGEEAGRFVNGILGRVAATVT